MKILVTGGAGFIGSHTLIELYRAGDIATCYCDPAKAAKELGWKARYGLEEMCRDSWNWQKNNPNGYQS